MRHFAFNFFTAINLNNWNCLTFKQVKNVILQITFLTKNVILQITFLTKNLKDFALKMPNGNLCWVCNFEKLTFLEEGARK